ncbi:hypothetical protein BTA51_16945 [Hahella sp. CCB-MM4]|uniref:lipopolysaccharide assembly protein LapA domain-containing protein n=1 Tax=Hahella sp. (strain CCB-MM4) TaxID=1926491 RepID=UPI000B9AAF4F|nr:lipopolysaccharide assembly protein LapA domain-containing protein [Hahella sp. CCB-MM4]OZG72060.1 hypothetical protein BTA51_16945 [Hahella sp. CCB-MM4]
MAKIKKFILLLLVLVVFVIGLMFMLSNNDAVHLDLIVTKIGPIDVIFVAVGAFAVGLILGMMVTGLTVLKLKVVGPKNKAPKSRQTVATNN